MGDNNLSTLIRPPQPLESKKMAFIDTNQPEKNLFLITSSNMKYLKESIAKLEKEVQKTHSDWKITKVEMHGGKTEFRAFILFKPQ